VKKKFGYDDALDVFGCHGVGGIWGGIATGLFTQTSINSTAKWNGLFFGSTELLVREFVAIGVSVGVAVVGTLLAVGVAKLFTREIRVSEKDEEIGLDISEHGESAYPAFNGMD
jgi:Amt family ammonium transporter